MDAPVLRVVVVQTDSPDAYVKEIDRGRDILKRLGSASTIRVWQARYAGIGPVPSPLRWSPQT